MDVRNRYARARRWLTKSGATAERHVCAGAVLWYVHRPGFHVVADEDFLVAVEHLRSTVERWCAGSAVKGPTGAKLEPLRRALGGD